MIEGDIRKTLAELDQLRAEAKTCTDMHTHWMFHDGELVEEIAVTVKRRWRGSKTLHSEIVMDLTRRELFRSWLTDHASSLYRQIAVIEESLSAPAVSHPEPTAATPEETR